MRHAAWTYELPPAGADSEGLEDYEARTADGQHAGVVVGLVRRGGELFVLVDAGAMPPLIHRRIAFRWQDVAEVDNDALVVQLAVARAGLEEAALALDPEQAVHGPGAEAERVTRLPAELMHAVPPGVEGPAERGSAILLAVLAAAAPFSLFVIAALWIARGLSGWEYALLAIPFVLGALTFALEGYRLYREPHLARGARPRPPAAEGVPPRHARLRGGGKRVLVLFAVGGGVVYLTTVLGITLALGEELPLLGWIGFAVAATIVLAAGTGLAVFLVRASAAAGAEPPARRRVETAGAHRVLVVADEGCSGAALCRPLVADLMGAKAEVLVVSPALVSGVRYLDSDLDPARRAAQRRLDETVGALAAAGVTARGEIGSESPLEAIADALAVFAADEIVVATPPPERTNWLEQGVVERARELYTVPVAHLVVEAPGSVHVRPR
ncbi:MAG TPA: hypothetical protein VM184_09370 [Gaiellaceae bacterium]|nr:hypothetical protein [Gaiellaceae bacterium]